MKKSKKITGIAGATLIGTTVFYLKARRKAKKERTKKEQIQQKENQQEQKKQSQKKSIPAHKPGFYEKYIKRPQDFSCALAAIIVLSPVMLVTAVLVRTKLGSPVIFKQERPGLNGKIFTLYKFRTMTDKTDANGELLPDEDRDLPVMLRYMEEMRLLGKINSIKMFVMWIISHSWETGKSFSRR